VCYLCIQYYIFNDSIVFLRFYVKSAWCIQVLLWAILSCFTLVRVFCSVTVACFYETNKPRRRRRWCWYTAMICLFVAWTTGYRLRRRTVLQASIAGGLSCPALYEVQPCEYERCHTWTLSSRGECQLDEDVTGSCGDGQRNNTVVCVDLRHVRHERHFGKRSTSPRV